MNPKLPNELSLLPTRLAWHVLLTVCAMSAGLAVSLPLAIFAARSRRWQGPTLALVGVIQTVPSLALLALMVPLLGLIGFVPALLALILYSMLPIVRNTVTGIAGIDPALIEAARGVGMTERQTLLKVQLPLAAPIIIAGIRTATVWVVGIATLSTPVGQSSLGDYIFSGLHIQDYTAVIIGCAAAAALALVLDGLIRVLELAAARRSRVMGIVGAAGLVAAIGTGLWPLAARRPDAFVGSKTFTEQYILADVIADRLAAAGFRVAKTEGMGSTILFNALADNNVDCYVDYSGTIWANVMHRTDTPGSQAVLNGVTRYLKDKFGIVCLGRIGFANAYCLAMRRARSEALGVTSIADLAPQSPALRIGGDYEFFARPEWKKVSAAYGLRFGTVTTLDSALMYSALKTGQVDVISAYSSDGRIAAYDLRVLADPRHAFPPYDAILLVSPRAATRPGFLNALRPLIGSIDDDAMRNANESVDLAGQTPAAAAAAFERRR